MHGLSRSVPDPVAGLSEEELQQQRQLGAGHPPPPERKL